MKHDTNTKKHVGSVFKKISVGTRAYLYVFLMGLIGGAIGTLDIEVKVNNIDTDISLEAKIQRIAVSAIAGMSTATLTSLPALLKEE